MIETDITRQFADDPVGRFLAFVRERHAIYERRRIGLKTAIVTTGNEWTDDPILGAYRFCNVYRELDRVTLWIKDNWREKNADDPHLWFAMIVARFINWPETLFDLGYPVPWRSEQFKRVMASRVKHGEKLYTGAYMIRAGAVKGEEKYAYQEREVFTPLWDVRYRLKPRAGDTLNSYHVLLGQFHGLGSFMAAQVVADLKYVSPLKEAADWATFAASGPGSRKGLNYVLGRPVESPWTEEEWRMELDRLRPTVVNFCEQNGMLPPHAQDVQNCLCEFSKWERTRLGLGRPRARYP
jgi:hypothetical protein